MWLFKAPPAAVLSLLALTLLPSASAKLYPSHELSRVKRQCNNPCGYEGQYCCEANQACFTNVNNVASCTAAVAGGGWLFSTFTYTQAETVTRTSIWSTFVGAAPTPTLSCSNGQQACLSQCCQSGNYCADPVKGICKPIGGGSGSPGVTGIVNPSAPVRPTSNGVTVITATGSPTVTLPFSSPIPTGVNGTLVEQESGGGLSGGAIAGIVIGVIAGIILLLLICFYCCAKAAFDGLLAIFGLGKRRNRHTHEETTYIEEHHSSGAAGGRRWYGAARPARPPKKEGGGFGNLLGIGAGLAGLAAVLGMKRKHDRKHDDKSTTISGSSYYYSDYTSSSEFTFRNHQRRYVLTIIQAAQALMTGGRGTRGTHNTPRVAKSHCKIFLLL